jgi:hypothetical protein
VGTLVVRSRLRLFQGHAQSGCQEAQRAGVGDTPVFVLTDRLPVGRAGAAGFLGGLLHQLGHLPLREGHLPTATHDQLGQRDLARGFGLVR